MDFRSNHITRDTIANYVYGDMTKVEEAEFERYLEKHPEWQSTVDDMTDYAFESRLAKSQLLANLTQYKDESYNLLFRNTEQPKRHRKKFMTFVGIAAVTFILLLGIGSRFYFSHRNPQSPIQRDSTELQSKGAAIDSLKLISYQPPINSEE